MTIDQQTTFNQRVTSDDEHETAYDEENGERQIPTRSRRCYSLSPAHSFRAGPTAGRSPGSPSKTGSNSTSSSRRHFATGSWTPTLTDVTSRPRARDQPRRRCSGSPRHSSEERSRRYHSASPATGRSRPHAYLDLGDPEGRAVEIRTVGLESRPSARRSLPPADRDVAASGA